MNNRYRSFAVAALAWMPFTAGTQAAHAAPRGTQVEQSADGAAPSRNSAGLERASPGKPTAPIAISHELSAEPRVGQPVEIRITARVAVGAIEATIELQPSDALAVSGAVLAGDSASDARERVWVASVTPLQDATAYLNVTVSADLTGERQSRSVSLAIRTAGAKQPVRSAAAVKTAESAEPLIVLPAQESP